MGLDLRHDRSAAMRLKRHGLYLTISFDHTKVYDLSSSTPATFAKMCPAKRGFVKFQRTTKRFTELFV